MKIQKRDTNGDRAILSQNDGCDEATNASIVIVLLYSCSKSKLKVVEGSFGLQTNLMDVLVTSAIDLSDGCGRMNFLAPGKVEGRIGAKLWLWATLAPGTYLVRVRLTEALLFRQKLGEPVTCP